MPDLRSGRTRKFDELVVRYKRNPGLRNEIWVEGSFDVGFYRYFLERNGRVGWHVYPIHTVEFPVDPLRAPEGTNSERNRVIELCRAVCEALPAEVERPIFIIDWDLDSLTGSDPAQCRLCLVTDFPSVEIYAIDPASLQRFISLYVQTDVVSGELIFESIAPALNDCFLVRAALHRENDGTAMHNEVSQFCERAATSLVLQVERLVDVSLRNSSAVAPPSLDDVLTRITALRVSLPDDRRRAMHKKDAAWILKMAFERLGLESALLSWDNFRRIVPFLTDFEFLPTYPMFRELLRRTD